MNEMVDQSTAREAESVDLFVPPVIEEPTEADMTSETQYGALVGAELLISFDQTTKLSRTSAGLADPFSWLLHELVIVALSCVVLVVKLNVRS